MKTFHKLAFAALLSATALGYSMGAYAEGGTASSASGAGVSAGSSVGSTGGSPGTGTGTDDREGNANAIVNTSTVRANGSTSEGTFDNASTPASDTMNTSDSSSSDSIPLNNSTESANEDVPNANTTGQSMVNSNRDPNAAVSGNADAQGRQGESDTLTTKDSSSSDTIEANGTQSNTTNVDGSEPAAGGSMTTVSTTTYSTLEGGQIRSLQSSLKSQGFTVGRVDGIWGPRTATALRNFQQSNDLPVTGELDANTMARLNANAQAGVQ